MDQTRDISGRQLHRIIQRHNIPDFVKKASIEQMCGTSELPSDTFGDPIHRLFPCHTAAATWTSAAYFLENRDQLDKTAADMIEKRIEHASFTHGIDNAIGQLRKSAATRPPTMDDDLDDEHFALIIENPDGSRERHYRMTNGPEVKAGAAYLRQYRDQFPYEMRRTIAEKILQKSAELRVILGPDEEFIEKQAGYGTCSAAECAQLIRDRVTVVRSRGIAAPELAEMEKMAELVVTRPSKLHHSDALQKMALVIDTFDRKFNIKYDVVPRPEDVLFDLTREKVASVAREHVNTLTGNIYKLADLEEVTISSVRDFLGDEFADALCKGMTIDAEKAAAIIPTLPLADADLFDRFMESIGKAPIAKEASQRAIKLGHAYLAEIARGARATP